MNRLADSHSPYLLQHQNNPVDWFPWGEAAFEAARKADRPLFLSVGYAACHWCHVMEHESFENNSIAEYLNANFVSVKVDREERPDIDQVYMNAVQIMTGHGGWPMSVFLDHQLKPFYAGTYWPAVPRGGMPGFLQVLEAVADAWQHRRDDLARHATEIAEALTQVAAGGIRPGDSVPEDEVGTRGCERLLQVFDRHDGGFGRAPKFPHAADLELLLRRGLAKGDAALIETAEFTLDKMAAGGIRDHLGGGFARYSVDARWLVPHFEKMLYDNALLGELYVRAFQVTGQARHAEVATEVFDYLRRDMVDPSGGFHCSEDADSEGEEGKFYVWSPEEVVRVLGRERGERFCQVYDITPEGNFEGKSIPNLPEPIQAWAERWKLPLESLRTSLAEDREALRLAREARVRPGRDDKIVTAWNALAVRALAVAGAVLDRDDYLQAAHVAAEFIHHTMRRDDGRLWHAFRRGVAHIDGFLDDYAYTAEAYLALFEGTGDAVWVSRAVELVDRMIAHFEDKQEGGFFYTADDGEALITRNKEWHDGSLISGNASAGMALLKLARLTTREELRSVAAGVFRAGREVIERQSTACGALLAALDRYLHDEEQIVVAVGDDDSFRTARSTLMRRFHPRATVSWARGDEHDESPLASLHRGKSMLNGETTLYRCHEYRCDAPLSGPQALTEIANLPA